MLKEFILSLGTRITKEKVLQLLKYGIKILDSFDLWKGKYDKNK